MSPRVDSAPSAAQPLVVTQDGLVNLASVLNSALDGAPLSLDVFVSACNAAGKDMREMLCVFQGAEILVFHEGALRLGPMGYALLLRAYMGC